MAGSGKVAVLATLMFALLLSGSLIEAARPIVAEGSNIATDGTLVVRDAHSRQLRTFGWWPWWGGCWSWFWGGCGRRYVQPVIIKADDDKRRHSRKLNTIPWFGWGGWGWGHGWGWGWGRGWGYWG